MKVLHQFPNFNRFYSGAKLMRWVDDKAVWIGGHGHGMSVTDSLQLKDIPTIQSPVWC